MLLVCVGMLLPRSQRRSWAQATPTAAPRFGLESLIGECSFRMMSKSDGGAGSVTGQLSFDGSGNVGALLAANSLQGTFQPFTPYSGTYTAHPDGTGAITIDEGGALARLLYRVNPANSLLELIVTDPSKKKVGTCVFSTSPRMAWHFAAAALPKEGRRTAGLKKIGERNSQRDGVRGEQ